MKFKKSMALILVACMLAGSLAACGKKNKADPANKYAGMSYDEASSEIYEEVLGDFNSYYAAASAETNVSMRYALFALSEAKLLESATMIPLTTQGGRYAISRVAPYTVDYVMWGNDSDRYHQALIATDPITTDDRAEMKAKWGELKGTGTYLDWAKEYLTDKGYTLKDTYSLGYTSDPLTWDALATSKAADSEAIVNTYDGLVEYDVEGILQPALAESWEVSEDGLTYTFHLREGATWVDSQGRYIADVVADDFVAGMQHMCDAMGGLEWLLEGVIVGVSEYIEGTITDFAEVGVKAVDDHTVTYTLCEPSTYFITMLGYNCFAPMSRTYYESMGGKFGIDYDAAAETYLYGKDSNSIAYCGPYLVTNATANSTIVFTANESYWNADNINIHTITWLFNDGSDETKAYNDVKAGVLDGVSLTSSTMAIAKEDGWFDQYHYISSTNATSYMGFINVNRASYANVNDENAAVSTHSDESASNTRIALSNVHFRRALGFAWDRGSYNGQITGDDLRYTSLRNSYVPGNFVFLSEDVTVDINGTLTTFAKGTAYGAIVQAQLDADGIPMQVWNPEADDGAGSSDGYDGWYNVEAAKAELEIAIAELSEVGVEVSAENPIHVEIPCPMQSTAYVNQKNAMKQSIEASLEGKVIIDLLECADYDEWYYCGYNTNTGDEANYDIYDLSGWGPDYGDPSSFLNTMLPDYAGYMAKCIGIF